MEEAGLPEDETLKIEFDLNYPQKQVKMVTIHGVRSKASMCPVIIHGSPQSKLFAWTVGLEIQQVLHSVLCYKTICYEILCS